MREKEQRSTNGGTVVVPNCAVPWVQTLHGKIQCAWDVRSKKKGWTLSAMVMGLEAGRMAVVLCVDFFFFLREVLEGKRWKET